MSFKSNIFKFIPITEKNKNIIKEKYKNRYRLTKKKFLKKILKYNTITFDIFDTLITRMIYQPDDIFDMMGEILNLNNFKEMRKESEKYARNELNKDVNINEIYQYMIKKYDINKTKAIEYKQLEKELEIKLVTPRVEMQEVFNKLKKKNKKIVLISDMYLDKNTIKKMLKKCGYVDYDEFYLSNSLNKRKDTGDMWDYAKKELGRFIHIGDNHNSDYQIPISKGIKAIEIDNSNELLHKSALISIFNESINKRNISDSILLGLLINKSIFNSPFSNLEISNMEVFGYAFIAPLILEYIKLIDDSTDSSNQLLFLSREGYELQKLYKKYCKIFDKREIINTYFLTSRRATTLPMIENYKQIKEICKKDFIGNISNFLKQVFEIEYKETDFEIILPRDYKKVIEIVNKYKQKILKRCEYERKMYLKYMNMKISNKKQPILIDLGYSGSIQYNLNYISNKNIDGIYMISSDSIKRGNNTSELKFLYNAKKTKQYIEMYHNSLLLEYFLSAPYGQLLYFDNNKPVYNKETLTQKHSTNIKLIEKQIARYFSDIEYVNTFYNLKVNKDILFKNFKNCSNEFILSKTLKDQFMFIDLYNDTKEYNIFKKLGKY